MFRTIGIILFLVALIFAALWVNHEISKHDYIQCPPIHKDYERWFPYKVGDILSFTSKGKSNKYSVTEISIMHTESINKYANCGGCENSVIFSITDSSNTITIELHNWESAKSSFGERYFYSSTNRCFAEEILTDSTIQTDRCMLSKDLKLVLGKGLLELTKFGEKWTLEGGNNTKAVPSATDIYGCD